MSEETENKVKIAKRVAGGSLGAGALFYILVTYIDAKLEAVTMDISKVEQSTRQYVDQRHNEVTDTLDDMKKLLVVIDQRVFELSKQKLKE